MILAGTLSLAAFSSADVITQSNSFDLIAGSVACSSGGKSTVNSYGRGFTVGGPFSVSSAFFGVEIARDNRGAQSITVDLYDGWTTQGDNLFMTGGLIGTSTFDLGDMAMAIHTLGINAVSNTGQIGMVVTSNDDGTSNGFDTGFYIGSNNLGQTGPSYIAAADCGIPDLLDLGAIGFGDMHMVMGLEGSPVPEPASIAALGLGALVLLRRRK